MKDKKGFVTIGHGKRELKTFVYTLLRYKVNAVVDVRSVPYSKFSPQFNKGMLESELLKHKITYIWMGDSLGGRPSDSSVYDDAGIVDYERLVKTKPFLEGLEKLEELSTMYNIAIMCSEVDPFKCHRFLAISRELSARDYKILHVIDEKRCISQQNLESRLVKIHFGEFIQMDLFTDHSDTINESYIRQSKNCAFRRK